MSPTPPRHRASAVLSLAAGQTKRAAAEAAEVSATTIATWLKDRTFAAEVTRARALYREKSGDGRALLDLHDDIEQRLTPQPAVVVEGGTFHTVVTIPADASPRQRERLTARAIARGLRAVREAES